MTDKINLILFFLQTLHYRDDLEEALFENLKSFDVKTNDIMQNSLYGQKVHPELTNNTLNILKRLDVLRFQNEKYIVDQDKLNEFILLVKVAKASRSYNWPSNKPKPFLFVSPQNLITADLSGDVDDISNFLTNLVRSAKNRISIMSPFTNKDGLRSVLTPIKACVNNPQIFIYLTVSEIDKQMIFSQIESFIPNKMKKNVKVFFCTPELIGEENLPHAKLLTIDSQKGYLGSANFTRQGLNSRFEVGVELDDQQSKTIEKLLDVLVNKKMFVIY